MMLLDGFLALVDRIKALGYDEETAAEYASLIGDTPMVDGDQVVVIDENGQELARLPASIYD